MMRKRHTAFVALLMLAASQRALAQPPSPRIGPFVIDVRGAFPSFPADAPLANSRGLNATDLPGVGIGIDLGAHLYLFRWRVVTLGVGGEVLVSRAHSASVVVGDQVYQREVTERFTSAAPQISLNFGSSKGWSYLSAGLGQSTWSIVPDAAQPLLADEERLKTLNFGGGARWFSKQHLAFTFDVRFYAINPGTSEPGYPGSPRTRLLVISAGVSVR